MPRILGLDISSQAVRGTLVRTTLRRAEVVAYLEEPIDGAADPQGRADALRHAVRTLVGRLDQRAPDGIVAELDGHEASLRVVELPAGAAKRAAEVLPFELEALLPFPIEDAIIDHQPIERTADKLRLLATAAPKAKIAARLEELREAGIEPRELAVGAAALDGLVPVLPRLQSPGPHVIVDIGERTTDVCILRNARCELARTLSTGIADVRSGHRTNLEAQLRHTLASYRASGGTEPEGVLLGGEAASYPNATDWLGGVTGIETHIVPLPPIGSTDDSSRPRFVRSTALAARLASRGKRFDLRQGEFARRRAMGVIRQNGRLIAICTAAVLASFAFASYARWTILDDDRSALHAELSRVTSELFDEETADPARARELLTGEAGPSDPLPRFDAFDALDAVSRRIPESITHDTRRLHIELDDEGSEGRFELQGTVESIAERDTIAQQLESHECVTELERGRTTPGPGNTGLNYQLEGVLRCPGAVASAGTKKASKRRGNR